MARLASNVYLCLPKALCSSFNVNNIYYNVTSISTKATIAGDNIVGQNTSFLKRSETLPNIYWTLKLCKNPTKAECKNTTKAEFKIATSKCSGKPLSKVVAAALKLIYKEIEHYNFKTQYYSVMKTFCSVQKNQAAISIIIKNKINSRYIVISIFLLYFSTVHANRPHDKLNLVMVGLIKFCFNG